MVVSVHGECVTWTPSAREICYPKWVKKTIEAVGSDVGDVTYSTKTRG
jgi:hypothetical protein